MVNFLNVKEDLPIVAHVARFDRDDVLAKAFEDLKMYDKMPKKERWRCTFEYSDRVPEVETRSLDELCKHFGIKGRADEDTHDAVEDCELTAQVYMKLMLIPPLKMATLGLGPFEED